MKSRELQNLGIPCGEPVRLAMPASGEARKGGMTRADVRTKIAEIVGKPEDCVADPVFGKMASSLIKTVAARARFEQRTEPAPYRRWGTDMEAQSIQQMENACKLPVSVAGALMPDAHTGYGLPIGGVLATKDAVIPYAVGMDIACRMKLSVLDMPASMIRGAEGRLRNVL